jgi:hypothetical protein
MADISMCNGNDCPIKKECYRHTAPTNQHWQAYFMHIPYDAETKTCEMFWDNSEYTKEPA